MDKNLSNLGERLTELMFYDNNMTTRQLGAKLGVSSSTVSGWKNGTRSMLLSNALKLADYFECSLSFLTGHSRDDKKLDYIPHPVPQFYNRLLEVLKEKGITRYRLVKDTKFSNGNISRWKEQGDPLLQSVIDLADYFGYTLDHFVGRERL